MPKKLNKKNFPQPPKASVIKKNDKKEKIKEVIIAMEEYTKKTGRLSKKLQDKFDKQIEAIDQAEFFNKKFESDIKKSDKYKNDASYKKSSDIIFESNAKDIQETRDQMEETRLNLEGKFYYENNPLFDLTKITGMNYCGPTTKIQENIAGIEGDNPVKPVNRVDQLCMLHDIQYTNITEEKDIRASDNILIKEVEKLLKRDDLSVFETLGAKAVKNAMRFKIFNEDKTGLLSKQQFAKVKELNDEDFKTFSDNLDDNIIELKADLATNEEKLKSMKEVGDAESEAAAVALGGQGANPKPPSAGDKLPPDEQKINNEFTVKVEKLDALLAQGLAQSQIVKKIKNKKSKESRSKIQKFTRIRNAIVKQKEDIRQFSAEEKLSVEDINTLKELDPELERIITRELRNEQAFDQEVENLIKAEIISPLRLGNEPKLGGGSFAKPETAEKGTKRTIIEVKEDPSKSSSSSSSSSAGGGAGAGDGGEDAPKKKHAGGRPKGSKNKRSTQRSMRPFLVEAGSNNIRRSRQEMEDDARDFANFSWQPEYPGMGVSNELIKNYQDLMNTVGCGTQRVRGQSPHSQDWDASRPGTTSPLYLPPQDVKYVPNRHQPIEDLRMFETVNISNAGIGPIKMKPSDNFRHTQQMLGPVNQNSRGYSIKFAPQTVDSLKDNRNQTTPLYFPDNSTKFQNKLPRSKVGRSPFGR